MTAYSKVLLCTVYALFVTLNALKFNHNIFTKKKMFLTLFTYEIGCIE
jgi:hypothetical protein